MYYVHACVIFFHVHVHVLVSFISDNSEYMLEEIKRQPATIDRFYGRHLNLNPVIEFNLLVVVVDFNPFITLLGEFNPFVTIVICMYILLSLFLIAVFTDIFMDRAAFKVS